MVGVVFGEFSSHGYIFGHLCLYFADIVIIQPSCHARRNEHKRCCSPEMQ